MHAELSATDERHATTFEASFDIEFRATRSYAGTYYDQPEPSEIHLLSFDLVKLEVNGQSVPFSARKAAEYEKWAMAEYEERIEEKCDKAADEARYARSEC